LKLKLEVLINYLHTASSECNVCVSHMISVLLHKPGAIIGTIRFYVLSLCHCQFLTRRFLT